MTKFKTFLGFMLFVLVFPVTAAIADYPTSGSSAGSLGKVTVDTDVSSWTVGTGQPNGKFVVAERKGIEIGLRAQERFEGPLDVTGDKGNRVGIYEAVTGGPVGDNLATWNYDFHVDLANAEGIYEGKVLDDYRLVLEQDFTGQSLFGVDSFPGLGFDPVELPTPFICAVYVLDILCQQSWNPGFGNDDFNPGVEGTYNLRLVLIPKTFSGPAIAVAIRVIVSD